jgi:hypothetical protein
MPGNFVDLNTPRHQLPVDQLPRGLIKFPQLIVDQVAKDRAQFPPEIYSEPYARATLEDHTLAYYFDGLPVAYRPAPDGVEVLAVGWEEVARYRQMPESGVQVVQP